MGDEWERTGENEVGSQTHEEQDSDISRGQKLSPVVQFAGPPHVVGFNGGTGTERVHDMHGRELCGYGLCHHDAEEPKPCIGSCAVGAPKTPGDILREAIEIVDSPKGRQDSYGRPKDCFRDIAIMWETYLGHPVSAQDVAMLMVLLKVVRQKAKHKDDNLVDAAGYAALAVRLER